MSTSNAGSVSHVTDSYGMHRNSFHGNSTNPSNVHTTQQLTQGIDHTMSMYSRRKRGGKSVAKIMRRKKRRLKKRKNLLKILRPKKALNFFIENQSAQHGITIGATAQPELAQEVVDGPVMFAGGLNGGTRDVMNLLDKIGGIDWHHDGAIQNQNKTGNLRVYDKCTLIVTFNPLFDITTFGKGLKFDVYECVAAKNITDVDVNTPSKAWTWCLNNTQTWAGSTRPAISRKTMTPFDTPGFGEYWKILNVTRFFCGNTDTLQLKMHQQGLVDWDKYQEFYCIKGKTKQLMYVFNPVFNGENLGGASNNVGQFHYTRKHRYYSVGMESGLLPVNNLSVTNAVTHSILP